MMNNEKMTTILQAVERELDFAGVTYTKSVLRDIIGLMEQGKENIRKVLRSVEGFDEKTDTLTFPARYTIKPDYYEALFEFRSCMKKLAEKGIPEKYNFAAENLCCLNPSATIGEAEEIILKFAGIRGGKGLSLAKAYSRIIEAARREVTSPDWDFIVPSVDHYLARIGDNCREVEKVIICCASLNLGEWLAMSNGNSWRSCHNIEDGCYRGGCLSYALDKVSCLLYQTDSPEQIGSEKIYRQVCFFGQNGIFFSRPYGAYSHGITEQINRSFIEVLGLTSSEMILTRDEEEGWQFATANYSLHYPDYGYHTGEYFKIDFLEYGFTLPNKLIGHKGICLNCGGSYTEEGSLLCYDCHGVCVCNCCGIEINKDDALYINGNAYCDDCACYCEHCGCVMLVEDATYIDMIGYVCIDCLDENYTPCSECMEYTDYNALEEVEGEYYCSYCLNKLFSQCDNCGEWTRNDDLIYIENTELYFCPSCYDSKWGEDEKGEDWEH